MRAGIEIKLQYGGRRAGGPGQAAQGWACADREGQAGVADVPRGKGSSAVPRGKGSSALRAGTGLASWLAAGAAAGSGCPMPNHALAHVWRGCICLPSCLPVRARVPAHVWLRACMGSRGCGLRQPLGNCL